MRIELLLVVMAKALVELAGMFLLGRGVLHLLVGAKRDTNIFYQVICVVTNPVIRATRWIAPRFIVDRHMPFLAFGLVLWIWLAIVLWLLPALCGSATVDCSALLQRKGLE
jgi:hypothetical protein